MARKRVTGRFYVFVCLLLVGLYLILREVWPDTAREALVQSANAPYNYTVDAVVVRDEEVVTAASNSLLVYVASEGQQVSQGDEVCQVYTSGYAEKELERLETVRKSIRSYHQQILGTIVDEGLERLEQQVSSAALELKTLIRNKSGGSLLNLERQLEEVMTERQEYLRQTQRQDYKLNDLYDQETKRIAALDAWRQTVTAPRDGLVSFYLDGYEPYLQVDALESLTPEQIHAVLQGRALTGSEATSRLNTGIFRVVSTDKWYIVLLSNDATWNPTNNQSYTFQMEGYPDLAYTGQVVSMQKSAGEVMAVLEVEGDPAQLLNVRSGRADIGIYLTGLSVPLNALSTEGGQTGVWLADAAGSTFIPVEVLSQDRSNALIQPITPGTLSVGQRVLIR